MIGKVKTFRKVLKNMGGRYVGFRIWHTMAGKSGFLKRKFPVNPEFVKPISLEKWKSTAATFFFDSRESINFPKNPSPLLKEKIDRLRKGELQFFNASYKNIGKDYDWITNPDSGFKYSLDHWLDVNDFSARAGDIKYVWEKSRFSYLCTIIRYDYHFQEDCSEWVFSDIDNWIKSNPINLGPNYKCSQEISLRILNWLFALYYYKNSPGLTSDKFERIINACYWQLHHVRDNIQFSRIAVRNNHAITETMILYLSGLFFPFFKEAKQWSEKGRSWLEEEVAYQVYEDGTFLQFSHNYHRVLIQLLTWTLYLSELNGQKLSTTFNSRTQKSIQYLYQCQVKENGFLPNYGANDGALFFPLNNCEYRNYQPQINALYYYFNREDLYPGAECKEDRFWYTANSDFLSSQPNPVKIERTSIANFEDGGYYINRDEDTLTFIRCGNHKDRPSHADNLHLDVWYKDKNILRDSGSFKYNTDADMSSYFTGTKGHNTVTLGSHSQMEKGSRFIWLNWSQKKSAELLETTSSYYFKGKIEAFQQLEEKITHQREWWKMKGKVEWRIKDKVEHNTKLAIRQYWNIHPDFLRDFVIEAKDENDINIPFQKIEHWFSDHYGVKEPSTALFFETTSKTIHTIIKLK